MISKSGRFAKRTFDIVVSFFGIFFLSPAILFMWFLASFDTKNNGFYLQKRVGRHGKIFHLIKIRTMIELKGQTSTITKSNDPRITYFGSKLRKYKLDELPQLFNIFIGQMSFVGPRPDVKGYADELKGEDKIILSIRPGITGPSSIKYKNESQLLSLQKDARKYNDEVIWPDKVKINKEYVLNWSFKSDIEYIIETITRR